MELSSGRVVYKSVNGDLPIWLARVICADGRVVLDKEPVLADGGVGVLKIMPVHVDDRSGARAYNIIWVQQLGDGLLLRIQEFHATILVLDDEDLFHTQEVRGNDNVPEGSYGTATSIADHMGLAWIDSKSRSRVDTGVDARDWTELESKPALPKMIIGPFRQ